MRIGIGIDVHPFAEGRKLVIGGVHLTSTEFEFMLIMTKEPFGAVVNR